MSVYKESNCDFIKSMNSINIYTTLYLLKKQGILMALPHTMVCITSYFFLEKNNK